MTTCLVEGCDRVAHTAGLCQGHYDRRRRYGDVGPAEFRPITPGRRCSISACARKHYAHGYCRSHYARWRAHGTVEETPVEFRATTPLAVWRRYVEVTGFCWNWTGGTNGRYGVTGSGSSRTRTYAHRWAYEQLVGPIPVGLEIDHLCFNTLCVNPDHLEPVTTAENLRRMNTRRGGELCRNGLHIMTEENTLYEKRGARRCRECKNVRQRKAAA